MAGEWRIVGAICDKHTAATTASSRYPPIGTTTAADAAYDADDIENLDINLGESEVKIVKGTGNKILIEADNTVVESRVDGDRLKISNDDDEYLNSIDIETVQNKFSFTIKSDLAWLNDSLTEDEFRKAYFQFLDNRFVKMKDKIKQSIF